MGYNTADVAAAQGRYLTCKRDPRLAPGLDYIAGTVVIFRTTLLQKKSAAPTDWVAFVSGGATSGGYVPSGSAAAPLVINEAVGFVSTADRLQQQYVMSNGGAKVIAANPQISAGITVGQKLILISTSAVDTLQLTDGSGVSLHAPVLILREGQKAQFDWDGTLWNLDWVTQ